MSSLIYIIIRSAKNSLKELVKKPAKLILYAIVILALVAFTIISLFAKPDATDQIPFFIFKGIFFVYISIFMIFSIFQALSSGSSFFEMSDVNLLFVSPVSSRKILLYGIIRLTRTAFLSGFFILFQSNSLSIFGITLNGILLILFAYMLAIVVLSILSLIIYNVTNGNPRRKLIVKVLVCLLFLSILLYGLVRLIVTKDIVIALEELINSSMMAFIPIAGWTTVGATHILSGQHMQGLLFLGANLFLGAGLIIYLLLSKTDYYEDVLVATETTFEKNRAILEGNINAAQDTRKNIKIAKTGISGFGASTILSKHLRESFRQNRFGFLSISSVFITLGSIIANYFIKDLVTILQILMWMQIFLIGTGRGLKELYSHYIYLIPESSFKKIIWSNMEIIIKTLLEGILIFGINGILIRANIFIIIGTIVAYTLFSFLLLSINYLYMRFTGANISTGLLIMIYFIMIIIIIAPGVTAAIIISSYIGGVSGITIGIFILSIWELVAGSICFAFSSGILHHCDMPTMKPKS